MYVEANAPSVDCQNRMLQLLNIFKDYEIIALALTQILTSHDSLRLIFVSIIGLQLSKRVF